MSRSAGALVYVILCAFLSLAYGQDALIVNTTQGLVQGQMATDGDYVTYYGIPYAGFVEGENRFKAPGPAPSFPGVFIASDASVVCAQPSQNGLVGVENCLVLNILTRNVTGARPVMVWLMGEHYTTGSYQGLNFRNIVEFQDVLVVTLNYRLSIFGFLCLRVAEAPGNAGLKDVIAGLRWVRQNIAAFGGDPNNVMLAGHGSGGAMVDLVTLSPLSSGLVHKAIAQSGTSLSPWAVSYRPVENARAVGDHVNYQGKSNADLARAFLTTDSTLLVNAINTFDLTNNAALFAPCLENPNLRLNDTFMTDAPINLIRTGNYTHVPFIVGFTNREGSVRAHQAVHDKWLERMDNTFEEFIQPDLNFSSSNNATGIIRGIRSFYFNERRISIEMIEDYLDYHGDTLVLVSAIRTAAERAKTSRAEVRLYQFAFIGSWSAEWPYPTIPLTGARHGQELVYLFNTGRSDNVNVIDMSVRDSLLRRWSAFARTGVPVSTIAPGNVEWPAVTSTTLRFLEYVQTTENALMESARLNPHEQRMEFWNNLYSNYYVAPQPGSAVNILGCTFLVFVSAILMKLL